MMFNFLIFNFIFNAHYNINYVLYMFILVAHPKFIFLTPLSKPLPITKFNDLSSKIKVRGGILKDNYHEENISCS